MLALLAYAWFVVTLLALALFLGLLVTQSAVAGVRGMVRRAARVERRRAGSLPVGV